MMDWRSSFRIDGGPVFLLPFHLITVACGATLARAGRRCGHAAAAAGPSAFTDTARYLHLTPPQLGRTPGLLESLPAIPDAATAEPIGPIVPALPPLPPPPYGARPWQGGQPAHRRRIRRAVRARTPHAGSGRCRARPRRRVAGPARRHADDGAAAHPGGCGGLPDGGVGRARAAWPCRWRGGDRLQFLSQSALPEVSGVADGGLAAA